MEDPFEEAEQPSGDPGMVMDSVEAGDTTPPTKRKSKFSGFGKIFKPWKWRKKKSSDKFKETSEGGEDPGKPSHATLKNGHTAPIGSARSSSPVLVEEEAVRMSSLGNINPEEDSKKRLAELSQAIHSGTLLSKPSPPLPPKRGIPLTLGPTSEPASSPTTKTASDQREKTVSMCSEPALMIRPSSPSPPLPTHTPPEPPRSPPPFPAKTFQIMPEVEFSSPLDVPQDISQQEDQKKEVPKKIQEQSFGESHIPSRLPPLPLHIRIQQALTSPLPVTPPLEGTHRAHSLLFESSDSFSEDSGTLGRTRSLPITIEMLKVPDDDEEEQTCPLAFAEDMASTSVTPKLAQCLQEEEKESDSDSEGPIQYRDEEDEDEDDEDESRQSALANRVKRKDTLAMKLSIRPSEPELNLNSWPRKSKEEWNAIRHQIGSTLIRRLSQRPTAEELEQRNILQPKNEADRQAEKREIKRRLTRKLSQRPTVAELLARKILRFNEYVEVTDAQDYDRRADKPWTKLTPADKAAIRKELNEFKSSEMEVHEDSKHFTRYHRP
ncbi:phosphatase and actin regulator 4 [Cricetulus griseus]